MRRVAHTIAVILYWRPEESGGLRQEARRRRVRISARLARAIQNGEYHKRPNDLLRDLAREIQDRGFLSMLYSLYDQSERREQAMLARKARAKQRRALTLDEKFIAADAGRYTRLRDALLEEARLRGLELPENMLRDHCHIFRKFFDWSTPARLKKLLALGEAAFHQRVYLFASELAIAAAAWANDIRFDWRCFRYAGFEREDLLCFLGERARHLDTLGLDASADTEAIRKRYILLAKRRHPDLGGDSESMRELNAAYAFLTRDGSAQSGDAHRK